MTESVEKKGLFRRLLDKYNELCKDLNVDNGGCRRCVPVIKQDPEPEAKARDQK
ncbi:DUF5363 domain-containing protein [Pasteurellaceae bacterium HPA106]|uniref:DUF5363 domain-containing protein n=1 Tax=Spirabiliibacterium pneumoniae TaxID=221400 RepID=UPI001AAD724C|nr:DUF5363 domain-containing protein [Spirabiliibacterium pneumoniae]MBE2896410.1 DUF5363 domain-containing protein [Spirabiliibacterium pneumoniae]